jgi:hypothetical protein
MQGFRLSASENAAAQYFAAQYLLCGCERAFRLTVAALRINSRKSKPE